MAPQKSRSRSREGSPSPTIRLPHDVEPISEAQYFQKSDEFRIWLKEEKRKYFDELSGERARSYFRKFVKAWNRGKLDKSLYAGVNPSTISAKTQTAYKWSFADKSSRVDANALEAARAQVGAATYGRDPTPSRGGGRLQGPSMPSASDLALAREMASDNYQAERSYKRKREKAEDRERIEDVVGPREVGREGMLEKKRMKRDGDRAFREKGDDGFEADESTLLGTGDSFKDQIAKRDAGRKRFEQKSGKDDKAAAARERVSVYKEKEKATMDMFQQLAKQRFG